MNKKKYSYDEALNASLKYFNGDELASKVFLDKYALRNNEGEILEDTPEKMHWRIAKEFARIEKNKFKNPLTEEEIFNLLNKFNFLVPQGSLMFGIGNNYQIISLSNCYLAEAPEDSYAGIFKTDQQIAQISKRRGGVGVNLSKLRPSGASTKNAARTSTGIVSWAERYSNTIREVGQHGRRGALMEILNVQHIDIEKFIEMKNDDTKVTGANISVQLTDEFLNAVEQNLDFTLKFPIDSKIPKITKVIKARDLWKKIIHSAWFRAEPGLLMWDRITKYNAIDCYKDFGFETTGTNPCTSGDTKIFVKQNSKILEIPIAELVNIEIEVWNGFEWSKVTPKVTGYNQPLYEVTLNDDKELKCTAKHNWILSDGSRMHTDRLKEGDRLLIGYKPNLTEFDLKPTYPYDLYVKKIRYLGLEPVVYCFNEPLRHFGVFNGILTGQCAELPLCELDSCRLLVQNLYSYVKNPFTKDAIFDFDLFYKHAKIAQRLMDDVIDLELEKINQIIEKIQSDPEEKKIKEEELNLWKGVAGKCFNGRRTGLGVTAEGDMLAALNIKYASDKSINFCEEVHKQQKLASFESSMEISKEIGPFPIWDWKLEKDSEFLLQIKKENNELYNNIGKYGRRNIGNLTLAPTGSVSILTQTTSGIEPLFTLEPYIRRKKINPNDKNVKVDFIDQNGDSWQEFKIYHSKVKEWMNITEETDIKKSPWYNCCAEDLDWRNRVKLQSVVQSHIDHAISSTLNLPEDVTEEKVAEIYETAWKSGCKGVTIYRKNCRSGVLIEDKKNIEKIKKNSAPKRPLKLKGEVHHFIHQKRKYYVAVGILDDDPYEVFTGINHDDQGEVIIPKDIKEGSIIKEERGKYILETSNNNYSLTNGHTDDTADALTRLCSTSLRHGVDISFIIHQLEKTRGPMFSFTKVLARTLKKYIKDGTTVCGEECPECKKNKKDGKLIRENGCVVCKECGWSKC